MKLYYMPGACSMASHIALNTIGADFEIEQVDTQKQLTENGSDFTQINPKGYVPALQLDDGSILTENPAILTYLARLKPESNLIPDNDIEFFQVLEALAYTSSEIHRAFKPFFSSQELTEHEQQQALETLDHKLEYFNQRLADGRDYLHGKQPYVSDFYFFVVANWSNALGFGLAKWPHIKNYFDRMSQLPAVITTMETEGLAGQAA